MGILSYLKNCFKRAFLYQTLIIFAIYRLLLAYKFYRDFMRKFRRLSEDLNNDNKFFEFLPEDDEDTLKIYMISLIVLSSLSILGIKFIQVFTGVISILNGFIYYNPIQHFRDFNKKFELNLTYLNDFLPSIEFLIFFSLGCAMIKNGFVCEEIKSPPEIEKNEKNNKKTGKVKKE